MRSWKRIAGKAVAAALTATVVSLGAMYAGTTPAAADEINVDGVSAQVVDVNQPMLRGVWIDTWNPGMLSPEQCELLVEKVRAANLNAIFPEIRKVGDAYYLNGLEPMADNIDGPDDWDPLQYLIELCHDTSDGKQRIEVHAWLVTLRMWRGSADPPEGHLFHEHPETIMETKEGETVGGGSMYADPGHPMTIEWTANVFRDVAERYDIDGIHHDYVRYPGDQEGEWGYGEVSLERFRARTGFEGIPDNDDPRWEAWRRNQVNDLVRRIYGEVMEANPDVLVSASTLNWALEMDVWDWFTSSPRLNAHQDWPQFMREGTLDLNVLMNYTREDAQPHRYGDWMEVAMRTRQDRHAIMGPGAYLNSIDDTYRLIREAVAAGSEGINLYSYNNTNTDGVPRAEFFERLGQELFTEEVPPSERPWKENPLYGAVIGQVFDDGEWVDGAVVTLNGASTKTLLTDGTGFYGFFRVAPGPNAVQVIMPDGSVHHQEVEVEAGLASRANFE